MSTKTATKIEPTWEPEWYSAKEKKAKPYILVMRYTMPNDSVRKLKMRFASAEQRDAAYNNMGGKRENPPESPKKWFKKLKLKRINP